MRGWCAAVAACGVLLAGGPASSATGRDAIVLPNGWTIAAPPGAEVETGTLPQGMALSPDGTQIAVVESGYNPPALSLYAIPQLTRVGSIALHGAMGRPVWIDRAHVLVAGANADALLLVDVNARSVRSIPLPKGSYPIAVAASPDGVNYAAIDDGDNAVRIGTLATIGESAPIAVGAHPGAVTFDASGENAFVTARAASELLKIDVATRAVRRQPTGLHPGALAVSGERVYVAQSDVDSVGVYAASDLHSVATIEVGDAGARAPGVSPNALTLAGNDLLVSLGAANSVAVIRGDAVAGRMPAGWYPTDALVDGDTLYVLNGKGEGARPNPHYKRGDDRDYIGAIEFGSLRAYAFGAGVTLDGSAQGASGWNESGAVSSALLRPGGPIKHVFFVLKENRTYDQVLGDVAAGNGDASLAWFGAKVTPNEHALAARFGLFDNAYTSGEVSACGHMWSDAAFATDYVERWWPALYGDRRNNGDDLTTGDLTRVPANGFVWDAARRANVSFRDFGELAAPGLDPRGPWLAGVPSLNGRLDARYAGWNLNYSDLDRVKEWRRDFTASLAKNALPQFEFIWLPGDHTSGSRPGTLTPDSYVAINDYALGQMVETLSHSPVWKSSAMFVIEDDAQDGPDHVSDQRTTLFVISPYARGGVRDEHYATVGVLRTIELMLGMQPLSAYDAMAAPLAAAFRNTADERPYAAIPPKIDVTRRNAKVAYGAALSARLDFSRPDAIAPGVMNDILAHNH